MQSNLLVNNLLKVIKSRKFNLEIFSLILVLFIFPFDVIKGINYI
jgi:hypothetical protein